MASRTWQNVIGVARVGATDDFFDLGGNSPRRPSTSADIIAPAPLRTGGTRAPLFLVHPIGGSVTAYARLASASTCCSRT